MTRLRPLRRLAPDPEGVPHGRVPAGGVSPGPCGVPDHGGECGCREPRHDLRPAPPCSHVTGFRSERPEYSVDGADGDRQRVGLAHQLSYHVLLEDSGVALGTCAEPECAAVEFQPSGRGELAVAITEHHNFVACPNRVAPVGGVSRGRGWSSSSSRFSWMSRRGAGRTIPGRGRRRGCR